LSQGIRDNDAYYCILSYTTVTLNFSCYILFPQRVTTKSQWYNCFIRNGGNTIPKCSCPEVKGSSPTVEHTLLWDHHPFRGNPDYLLNKPDGLSPKDALEMKKVLRFKYATWNVRGLGEEEEGLDKILNENNIEISVITESKKR
jgi:hypothetical protein